MVERSSNPLPACRGMGSKVWFPEGRVPFWRKTLHSTTSPPLLDYGRFSDIDKAIWVVARNLGILQEKSFRGGRTMTVTTELLPAAETSIVKDAQKLMKEELSKTDTKGRKNGRYATLDPVLSESRV